MFGPWELVDEIDQVRGAPPAVEHVPAESDDYEHGNGDQDLGIRLHASVRLRTGQFRSESEDAIVGSPFQGVSSIDDQRRVAQQEIVIKGAMIGDDDGA